MNDIQDVLNRLTHNGEYANEVCLLLYLSEKYTSLYYLDYLNITGKELETLKEKCLIEDTLDCLTQTIRFLRSGFLDKKEIKDNLNSQNPIPFIDRLLTVGENWESAYEEYAGNFRYHLNNNKKR